VDYATELHWQKTPVAPHQCRRLAHPDFTHGKPFLELI
jgi:hypothetical protein